MADILDELWSSLEDIKDAITAWANKRQAYLDKADEIKVVYDRLKKDKGTVKGYKKSVKSYSNNNYDDFVGNNFEYKYKPTMTDLLTSYDTVIGNIDTNMDKLNDEILRYKNLASDCLGPLGTLGKAFHSIQTEIENWAN